MSFQDHKGKLVYAGRKLRLRWDETTLEWNDVVSRDFERQYLEPLEPKLVAAAQAIERLAEILDKAEKECR
jgi:hypothetical protein